MKAIFVDEKGEDTYQEWMRRRKEEEQEGGKRSIGKIAIKAAEEAVQDKKFEKKPKQSGAEIAKKAEKKEEMIKEVKSVLGKRNAAEPVEGTKSPNKRAKKA
jgi:hypothetical protein